MKRLIILSTVLSLALIIGACSELKNDKIPVEQTITVHGIGFADTTKKSDPNFHAKYIQTKNFDLKLCQSCHGADYSGGTTGQSCNTCHNKPNGPENCTTCHGYGSSTQWKDLNGNSTDRSIKGVGAHQKHLLSDSLHAAIACNECHNVPASLSSSGHIDATLHAEVKFNTTSVFFTANRSYDTANVSCANTYCHGNFNGGNNLTVTWTNTSDTVAACGTCHGDVTKTGKERIFPKTGHTFVTKDADCWTCHAAVINSSLVIIDPSRHINGRYN